MEQNYEYYAFISYKREDEKWAKWLLRKLENYRLPSAVCKEIPRLPKRVKPIFIDKDLGAGELTANIHSEMERSRYLIVICSPKSAQSEWVGKEISYFKELGRYGHIIPFIVDGKPNSDNPLIECFNPALKEEHKELLGINISEIGKEQAFIKVVAKLLNIRFDALWGRERRRQRRNTIYKAIVACLVVLLGLFVWEYKRPYYEYFTDYVDKWGIPEGVVELNREQCSRRNGMYRFEYRRIPFGSDGFWGWRLSQVDFVNSVGTIKEHTNTEYRDRFAIQKLIFDKENKGILLQTNYCNRSGRVILRYKYSQYNERPAIIVDFIQSQEQMGIGFISSATTSISTGIMDEGKTRAKITRYIYDRDDNGYIIKKSYRANNDLDPDKSKICDADGVAGAVYELDSLGRISIMSYIDMDDSLASTKIGVHSKKYRYDDYGNICEMSYLNLNGKLVLNEWMWAKSIQTSDEHGNIIKFQYFDIYNKQCLDNIGVALCKAEYDLRGNNIKVSYFSVDDKLCMSRENVAGYKLKYDSNGNYINKSYFDIDGNLCLSIDGSAITTFEYNSQGNITNTSFYDINGELCLNYIGYAICESEYNSQGYMKRTTYFDANKHLCLSKEGIAGWIAEYNSQGNVTKASCLGIDGKLCLNNNGIAIWKAKYNHIGNRIETFYYGVDDNLCTNVDGTAGWKAIYNLRGNIIENTWYGIDGELCLNNYGYASCKYEYDQCQNVIRASFLGVDSQPCLDYLGMASWESKYNQYRNLIECTSYDIHGKPCLICLGYANWKAKYDEQSNLTEMSYYDINDELVVTSMGYAIIKYNYDNYGVLINSEKLDNNNNNIIISNDLTTIDPFDIPMSQLLETN